MDVHLLTGRTFLWRVILACQIKGVPYIERSHPHATPGKTEINVQACFPLNVKQKLTVGRENEFLLTESMAMIGYLEQKFPQTPLLGESPEEEAEIWEAIMDFDLYVAANMAFNIISPIVMGQTQSPVIREAVIKAHNDLHLIDCSLADSNSPWLVGDRISAADITLYTIVEPFLQFTNTLQAFTFDLGFDAMAERYPALEDWSKSIQGIEGFEQATAFVWRQYDKYPESFLPSSV